MSGEFDGLVALVTGGASGIGAAVSELLAREGASVAVTDVDDLNGPEVVARIKKAGGEATFLHQDVTSEQGWIDVVAPDGGAVRIARLQRRARCQTSNSSS